MDMFLHRKKILFCIIFAVFFCVAGLFSFAQDKPAEDFIDPLLLRGKVVKVLRQESHHIPGSDFKDEYQVLQVEITEGIYKSQMFEAKVSRNSHYNDKYTSPKFKPGQPVILRVETDKYGRILDVIITDTEKDKPLMWLFVVFAASLAIVGKLKGIKSILSLMLTGAAVLWFMVPMMLKGHSPVLLSVVVCLFVIFVSLIAISGFQKKTFAAAIGTSGGIVVAGMLALLWSEFMGITGLYDEEARRLMYIPGDVTLDFKGMLFAGILIATMGATMDVGMTVASSIAEVKDTNPDIKFKRLYQAGMNVGSDAMSTMANTLILAYAGSSLNLILIFYAYSIPHKSFMNWEMIAVEVMRALTASTGLVIAIPITALVATRLFDKNIKK